MSQTTATFSVAVSVQITSARHIKAHEGGEQVDAQEILRTTDQKHQMWHCKIDWRRRGLVREDAALVRCSFREPTFTSFATRAIALPCEFEFIAMSVMNVVSFAVRHIIFKILSSASSRFECPLATTKLPVLAGHGRATFPPLSP